MDSLLFLNYCVFSRIWYDKVKMENPIIIYIPFSYQKMESVDGVVDKSYWRGI